MLTEGSIQIGALVLPGILKAGGRLFAQSRAPVAPTGQQRCFPNCFPAGTWIATEQGLRPIETIQASDRVWAFDLVAGKWRLCFVVETYAYEHDGDLVTLTVADEAIEATGKHPFWVVEGQGLERRPRAEHVPETPWGAKIPGRWVDAGDLQVGDVLLLRSGRPVAVTRLAVRHVRQQVYNFQVEELHCYAVGVSQVLVHNNCGEGASTQSILTSAAQRAYGTVGAGRGSVYGTKVHSAFQAEVEALGRTDLTPEVSYRNGEIVKRGTSGSIRLDVVEGPVKTPTAIYDLKTGSATLTLQRIAEIRQHLPAGYQNIPIIEIR
jgi:hypothetical protein